MLASRRKRELRATAARPRRGAACGAVLLLATVVPGSAWADRFEAQWSARPIGGLAQVREDGATNQRAFAGGLSLGVAYGLSNDLDIGGELVTLTTTMPTFTDAPVILDGGALYRGPRTRRSDSVLLLLGPTWRWGVAWVPVVAIGAGGGVRRRSVGGFTELQFTPDQATTVPDLAATVRAGVEHRMSRRLTVGAYVAVLASWSPSASVLPVALVSFGVSYVHYPLF